METISQLLDHKGHDVWSVRSDDQVIDAIRVMAEKGVGALVVIDDGKMVGIVSERDYARKVILQGRSSRSTAVAEIMTADVISADPLQSVDDCLALMSKHKFRHLPVVSGSGELVGVLSLGDLVKSVIDDQKHQIQSLETYISS
jgi:CBS domain-containing protein